MLTVFSVYRGCIISVTHLHGQTPPQVPVSPEVGLIAASHLSIRQEILTLTLPLQNTGVPLDVF